MVPVSAALVMGNPAGTRTQRALGAERVPMARTGFPPDARVVGRTPDPPAVADGGSRAGVLAQDAG
ncbi:hypothetical protein WME99_32810 [Sorangium sp. So ce136]|uniref:hypothetical protein n=1 Tax=Sorangium sp. So ce136 TaxID=3133284 RepID=UPI003F002158